MDCGKHKDRIVMHAFSEGDCIVCDKRVQTSHTPCDMVCPECSEKYHLCEICGKDVMTEKEKEKNLEYFESVKYRMREEGVDYCFQQYSNFEEIKDVKFHELRHAYLRLTKKMKRYVDNKIDELTPDE